MRRRGQQAFSALLSYRPGGGLVDALMAELDATAKLHPPAVTHARAAFSEKLRITRGTNLPIVETPND
jgi:hypothetical protein